MMLLLLPIISDMTNSKAQFYSLTFTAIYVLGIILAYLALNESCLNKRNAGLILCCIIVIGIVLRIVCNFFLQTQQVSDFLTPHNFYEYYQEHLDQYQKYDDISFSYLKVDLNQLDDSQKQAVQTQAAQLAQEMTQGKELQQQAEAYRALTPYITHVDILSDQVASYSRAIGDVMELGWDLQPGEDTGLVELNGYLFLVQCTSRVEYDYQPFEQVQSVILSQMRKERYETLLQQTADSLTIEADLTELESFIIQEMEDANGK